MKLSQITAILLAGTFVAACGDSKKDGESMADKAKEAVSSAVDTVGDAAKEATDAATEAAGDAAEAVSDAAKEAGDAATDAGDAAMGAVTGEDKSGEKPKDMKDQEAETA